MSSMTLFIIALVAGIACALFGSKTSGAAAAVLVIVGIVMLLFGGYGLFTSFI